MSTHLNRFGQSETRHRRELEQSVRTHRRRRKPYYEVNRSQRGWPFATRLLDLVDSGEVSEEAYREIVDKIPQLGSTLPVRKYRKRFPATKETGPRQIPRQQRSAPRRVGFPQYPQWYQAKYPRWVGYSAHQFHDEPSDGEDSEGGVEESRQRARRAAQRAARRARRAGPRLTTRERIGPQQPYEPHVLGQLTTSTAPPQQQQEAYDVLSEWTTTTPTQQIETRDLGRLSDYDFGGDFPEEEYDIDGNPLHSPTYEELESMQEHSPSPRQQVPRNIELESQLTAMRQAQELHELQQAAHGLTTPRSPPDPTWLQRATQTSTIPRPPPPRTPPTPPSPHWHFGQHL